MLQMQECPKPSLDVVGLLRQITSKKETENCSLARNGLAGVNHVYPSDSTFISSFQSSISNIKNSPDTQIIIWILQIRSDNIMSYPVVSISFPICYR